MTDVLTGQHIVGGDRPQRVPLGDDILDRWRLRALGLGSPSDQKEDSGDGCNSDCRIE